jgi:hypothetical protein
MADPAQDEVDRYFSGPSTVAVHPEDRDAQSDKSDQEEETTTSKTITSRRREGHADSDDNDSDNENMATMTATRTSYHIPNTTHHANTGPKGVIADAQNFHRAKKSSFRNRLSTFASGFASFNPPKTTLFNGDKKKSPSNSDHSDLGGSDEDSDSEFMNNWRAQRMQELTAGAHNNTIRRVSPSRRTWGTLQEVDANGYLDAIEKVSDEDIVVVMIFNPDSARSLAVEDELNMIAYRNSRTRFVKLHYDIAEMETVETPAVLAYRKGDVFATISGAVAQDLEDALKKHRVI